MLDLNKFVGGYKIQCEKGFILSSLDLDGKGIRLFLESKGVKCVHNVDTGRNGLVITENGFTISTNGYVNKI